MDFRGMAALAGLGLALGGCFAAEDDSAHGGATGDIGYMEDDLPAGKCRGDTDELGDTDTDCGAVDTEGDNLSSTGLVGSSSSSSGGPTDECSVSDDCQGAVCAGSFDLESEARTPFECVFNCLENLDEERWCSDDAACCDDAATCTRRGYCVVEPEN